MIDRDDEEHKEILGNARRNLETPMAPAMPCKRSPNGITKVVAKLEMASEKTPKTVHECMVESMNPQGNEWNLLSLNIMNTTLQTDSLRCQLIIWHTSLFPLPQGMKIPDAEAAVDEEWNVGKVMSKKGGYSASTKRQKESPLCNSDGHMTPQECDESETMPGGA